MIGNVWEWVEDCWHDDYIDAPDNGEAWTTNCPDDDLPILRGGSWIAHLTFLLRTSYRLDSNGPAGFTGDGFRCAQSE